MNGEIARSARWRRLEKCAEHKHFDKALLVTVIIVGLYAPGLVRWLGVQLVGPEHAGRFVLWVWWLGSLATALATACGYAYLRRRPELGVTSSRTDKVVAGTLALAVAISCVPLALLMISDLPGRVGHLCGRLLGPRPRLSGERQQAVRPGALRGRQGHSGASRSRIDTFRSARRRR